MQEKLGETDVITKAIIFAANAHRCGKRKGTSLPYILHPAEAAVIAASITDDPEVIAAAALHDVIEDAGIMGDELQAEFGERIRKLVESESENKRKDRPASETWKERKEEGIDYLQNAATEDERMIAIADKLSNIRECWRDYQECGDAFWEKFNMKDKKMQEWYYKAIRDALASLQDTNAWKEYSMLTDKLFGT